MRDGCHLCRPAQLLCYHTLGTEQSADPVIYAIPGHPQWMCGASITDDGRCVG